MSSQDGVYASVPTVCPFCACGCGLYLQKLDGELTGVMPSEHHPVSGGRLCARGWAAHEAALWGRRLSRPLVRNRGALAPTTWSAALSAAADRISKILAAGKPIGVLGSARATNEENFLAVKLARGTLQTSHIDCCLGAPYHGLLGGYAELGAGCDLSSALADVERCAVILLHEGDLALTHPQAAYAIMRAVRNGCRLVTLGAARTQMSRLASLHVPLIPGDEPILAATLAAMAESAISDNTGHVQSAAHCPQELPRNALRQTPPAGLQRAIDLYAAASRAAILLAPTGASAASLRAISSGFANLAFATGHLQRAGSVILPLPLRANSRGALEMGAGPNRLPGFCDLDDEAARGRLLQVWGCQPASERGLDVETMLGEVRGLIIVADDPPVALPAIDSTRKALAELDCLVVLDAFVTPTVEASHVALPIPSPAETDGTFTSMEGRVQWLRACTPPPAEARPGWFVLSELNAALGMPNSHQSVDDVLCDIRRAVPSYDEALSSHEGSMVGTAGILRGITGYPRGRALVSEELGSSRPESSRVSQAGSADGTEFPFQLVRAGAFDWGDDPLVDYSPTLRRDYSSLRKLFPDGLVEMSNQDAERLGIRHGWRVRIKSIHGETVVVVSLREGLESKILLVPFAFRDHLEPVLNTAVAKRVTVERT